MESPVDPNGKVLDCTCPMYHYRLNVKGSLSEVLSRDYGMLGHTVRQVARDRS